MLNSIKRKHHFGDKRFAKHFLFTIKCHVWQPFFRLKLTHIYLICCCCCCCFSAAFFSFVSFSLYLFALMASPPSSEHSTLGNIHHCQWQHLTNIVNSISHFPYMKFRKYTQQPEEEIKTERTKESKKFYRFSGGFDVWFWLFSSLPIYSLPVCWFFNISLYGIYVCLNMNAQPKRISFIFSSPSHTLPCFFFYLLWSMHLTELVHPIRHSDHSQNYWHQHTFNTKMKCTMETNSSVSAVLKFATKGKLRPVLT